MRLEFPDHAAKKILEQLAKEHKLPLHVVTEIVRSEFKMVSDTITKGTSKDVFLSGFGRYLFKVHHIKRLKNSPLETLKKNITEEYGSTGV